MSMGVIFHFQKEKKEKHMKLTDNEWW